MKKIKDKGQKGGMLLEAITVLGLIAVAAPSIYKKNIERTEEIRDMTKASQLRVLKDAASSYIEKRYEDIVRADKNGQPIKTIPVADLQEYLPAGFTPGEGVQVYINTNTQPSTADTRPQSLVSAIVVDGEDLTETRGNRVARMVGAEGGYSADDGRIYGNKGIWSLDKSGDLAGVENNRVVVSSTYSKNLSSSDYIYRNKVEGYPEANMMFTNIDMNGSSIERIGRLAFRYNNGDKWADVQIGGNTEGSTGGADRDRGLSLLIHGERGEIVGKDRAAAKADPRYEWENQALNNTSHMQAKTTVELSVGGPEKPSNAGANGEGRDGYLRLRDGRNEFGCTRIESNYSKPQIGVEGQGFTGGGAFVACTNVATGATGDLGHANATLGADDRVNGVEGSGYMLVMNPDNGRKALMYGNYQTSFNLGAKDDYSGAAIETVKDNGNVATTLAATLDGSGADKGENHSVSSVMNLNDDNESLKLQLRADAEAGYLHAYDSANATPTVSVAGNVDTANDRSNSVLTKRGTAGAAKMSADYRNTGNGGFEVRDNMTEGAVMSMETGGAGYTTLKENSNEKFKAIASATGGGVYLGNKANSTALSTTASSDQTVMVEANRNGTGGYMKVSSAGNKGLEVVAGMADKEGDTGAGGGMFASNTDNVNTAKLHSNVNGVANKGVGGAGLITTNPDKKTRAELGILSLDKEDTKNGNSGGTLALFKNDNTRNVIITARGPNSGGWMSISNDANRGVDIYSSYKSRTGAVVLSPNRAGSNSDIADATSTVELLATGSYNGSNFQSPAMNVHNVSDRAHAASAYGDISKTTSGFNGEGKGGSILVRKGSDTSGTALISEYDGNGAFLQVDGGSKAYAKHGGTGGSLESGSVTIRTSSGTGSIDAATIQASARVKVAGNLTTSGDVNALVVSANTYFGNTGSNMGKMIANAVVEHMPALASSAQHVGHFVCVKSKKNCKEYETVCSGGVCYQKWTGEYVGKGDTQVWGLNKDIYEGRSHDIALYTYGAPPDGVGGEYLGSHSEISRHNTKYDLQSKPEHWDAVGWTGFFYDALDLDVDGIVETVKEASMRYEPHNTKEKWHDNRYKEGIISSLWGGNQSTVDTGAWSKTKPIGTFSDWTSEWNNRGKAGHYAPDQVPPKWGYIETINWSSY